MITDFEELWNSILQLVERETSSVSFKTWFKETKLIDMQEDKIVVSVKNEFNKEILSTRYFELLKNSVLHILNKEYSFEFVLLANEARFLEKGSLKNSGKISDPLHKRSNLNPKYNFETFVVGNGNRMAHAAALAIAEAPALAYNPFFVYGGVGLGKTHLMQSIAQYILEQNPNSKVLYTSSEKFTNELINSIRDDENDIFRNKYRDIDVLLIDDIQFIAGKERTQEEFFHTFNTLYEANKQIIISSDRPPKEIETLEERLCSRFEWGLIADIQNPDLETRVAILRKKAESEGLRFPQDVLLFIANTVVSNIRELEGALTRILAYASLTNRPITIELAKEALKDLVTRTRTYEVVKDVTIEGIQEVVARHFDIKVVDLLSKKRAKAIVYPRQIAMYLSRKLTDLSLFKIGEKFNKRDHTTIMHGCDKITADLKNDEYLRGLLIELEKEIIG
ncbi:MAG: chromosomal replication initiation protein DnaA [Epulopiscium sp. Nele67-Bin005]|nr:MAG: chromosomal replication initiation protein DnaA [Epulopiscium sp. Nele67-Bin005]